MNELARIVERTRGEVEARRAARPLAELQAAAAAARRAPIRRVRSPRRWRARGCR